jgi:uncharacterized protein YpmS
VDWSILGRWEWLLLELIVLALAIAELMSLRRVQKRDREKKAAATRNKRPV